MFNVTVEAAEADKLQSGEIIYVTITDDIDPVDTIKPHKTNKAFGIVKSTRPEVSLKKRVENLSRNDGKYFVGDTIRYTITMDNKKWILFGKTLF